MKKILLEDDAPRSLFALLDAAYPNGWRAVNDCQIAEMQVMIPRHDGFFHPEDCYWAECLFARKVVDVFEWDPLTRLLTRLTPAEVRARSGVA